MEIFDEIMKYQFFLGGGGGWKVYLCFSGFVQSSVNPFQQVAPYRYGTVLIYLQLSLKESILWNGLLTYCTCLLVEESPMAQVGPLRKLLGLGYHERIERRQSDYFILS
jgi:hypothetical protein